MEAIQNKSMLEYITDAILVLDTLDDDVVYMNPACCRLLGFPVGVEEKRSKHQLFTPIDLQKFVGEDEPFDQREYADIFVQGCMVRVSCDIKVWRDTKDKTKVYCMLQSMEELISLSQFRAVIAAYPEPTFILELDEMLTVQFGNQAFHDYFVGEEESFADIFQGKMINTITESKRAGVLQQLHEQLQNLSGFCLNIELLDAQGNTHFGSFSGAPIPRTYGQKQMLYCRLHSTDEKNELIAALESEKFFFEMIQSLSSDLLFRYYNQENVIYYCGGFRQAAGLKPRYDNYPACLLQENYVYEKDSEDFMEMIRKMNAGEEGVGYYRVYDEFDKPVWMKKEWRVLCDANNKAVEVIGRISNIQNQREMEEQINIDTLTGCLRKQVFEMLSSRDLELAHTSEHTLLIVDLDNFKAVNDNLGHQFGDMVLAEVGEKLRGLFRASDYVGRVGGDEFMIFLRNSASTEIIAEKAKAILQEMDRTYQGTLHSYRISVSIGIATYPKDGTTFQELYDHADIALFDAKNRGKNSYVCYEKTLSKGTMENTMPFEVASRALSQLFDTKVLTQVFNLLFETKDLDISMQGVLQILGTRFDISRAYVFEASRNIPDCYDNTYEWCAQGVEPAIDVCQNIPKETFQILMDQGGDTEGIVYCNDVAMLDTEVKEILEIQGIQSFLHAYIYSGDEVTYAIGFDDCSKQRMWSPIEISTLLQVSKIIAQFLNYKTVLEHTQVISEERLSVMDSLNFFAYIIDKDSHKLSYFNKFTAQKIPDIQVGDVCYRVLRGLEEECVDCPLKSMKANEQDSVRKMIHESILGKTILVNASKLASFDGKESIFVYAHDITDILEGT